MEKIGNITIEESVPLVETRGRPTSDEYLTLLLMEVGKSFVSYKSRDTLYSIARNLGIPIRTRSAGEQGWRIWKMGERVLGLKKDKELIPVGAERYPGPRHGNRKKELHKRRNKTPRIIAESTQS